MWRVFALGLFAVSISGCSTESRKKSEDRAEVSGQVLVDGVPVDRGAIVFVPIDGASAARFGGDIINGRYHVHKSGGPAPGDYRVEVQGQKKTGKQIPVGPPSPPGTMRDEMIDVFPPMFSQNTDLKVELKAGPNSKDFDIKTK